ncbi:MAG: hypothetical protein IPL99_15890 [Candidatus Competibacteraceae bacterium]|nr:hypothetical protein [Candidatus Competibacteraceae bacterium]
MSAAILERQHFTVSQENRYFDPARLTSMIGQEQNQWRHAALKELIDNALDAAENVYPSIAPAVAIEFTETENGLILSVADNGPGIPAEEIPHISDFSSNSSTKLFYRAPLRGAQGNAIKTLIGMPVALGQEYSQLEIESQGQRHTIKAWLTVTGPKQALQQTGIDSQGTRVTVLIPGVVGCYHWEPARWLTAYSLFNPHARLQIRKIDPVWSENSEPDEGNRASRTFSDLSFSPTVKFPDPWRKFLPTDHTPAHWYSATEFKHLLHAKADSAPDQPLSDFIQEFKGLSRVWRKVAKAIPAKALSDLLTVPDTINVLHRAMQEHATAPRPDVLGRVGKDHFRQRMDEQFIIAQDAKGNDRFWYKHQSGLADGQPYMIEVTIAETERLGGVFYGLNYSVPFSDPLSATHLVYDGGTERLESEGLHGLLREAGAISGSRFGKAINTTAAVHLVMPLLPTLDLGKTRLAISAELATVIAKTVGLAAKTLHKEIIDWRQHQKKREQQQRSQLVDGWRARQREQERRQRELLADQNQEEREQRRQKRQEEQAKQAEQRRLRGELPTKQEVVFNLMLPVYLDITEQEQIRVALRDFWYVLYPQYKKISVRPSDKDNPESTDLDYGHFSRLVADYRNQHQPMSMIDYKARATLYEGHSRKEIAFGDRELRTYTLPQYEYAGTLFIEKQCVWPSLKDTGIADLAARYDLLIIISEGYATEAVRRLLVQAQQAGMKIMAWHDADPAGYNICRVLGEPTERMPDHRLEIIDLGLTIEEGLKMELQTETFTRKNAIPEGILPSLTDKEREFFTGEYDDKARLWRDCERIEINAIKIRNRVSHLESKIAAAFQAKPTKPGETPTAEPRPPIENIRVNVDALLTRLIGDQVRAAIDERIDLDAIAKLAKSGIQTPRIDDADLQAALDADAAAPWRDVVRRYADEAIDEQLILLCQIYLFDLNSKQHNT